MAKQRTLQLLRGTTAQNDAFTGAAGEVTVDTDVNGLRVHDGSTVGGHAIYTKQQTDTLLGAKANKDLSNLTSTGANIGNWSSNVSNCITEIPQDINLTLSNGTLTLKAGSKVYVPNGSGVFDVVNITADKTTSTSANGVYMYFINTSGNLQRWALRDCFSGTTAPTSVHYPMWYDTTNNIIKSSDDYGSTWSGKFSLPIAIVTVSNGAISSIDQVFNGFGYIGSSVFVLPGVKGLAPNGWNADGTLKNQVCSNSIVRVTNNLTSTRGYTCGIGTIGTIITFFNPKVYVQEDYPDGPDYLCWYRPSENKIYNTQTSAGAQTQSACAVSFYIKTSGGKIASLTPKTAFHAVDYNDLSTVALSGAYNDLIGKPTDLFDVKWSDHLLDNTSWLRADNFSWNSGVTYSVAYNHLVADIAGKTLQSETISGTTVQFYLANDGHKICPASEESNVLAIYNATGVAWYYIIDSANTRFKLPRSKHNKYTTTLGVAGNGKVLALTTGTNSGSLMSESNQSYNPLMSDSTNVNVGSSVSSTGWTAGKAIGVVTDATTSGLTTTAMAQETDQYKYLYFYVGSFTQTALENTAGLNASLFNEKADVNLLNTANNVDFVIESQEPTAENDYTWYRKYKSGWVEQGGIVSVSSEQTVVVSLPQPMNNANYHITSSTIGFGSNYVSTQANIFELTAFNQTQTGFSIHVSGDTDRNKRSWQVSGKAA